jgi:hypothetical protein
MDWVKLLVEAAWPLLILAIALIFFNDLKRLVGAFISRIETDESIKIGGLELQGARIRGSQQAKEQGADVFEPDSGVELRPATEEDFQYRKQYRYQSRLVKLVHTVLTTRDKRYPLRVLVYLKTEKILPSLDQDKGYVPARLNDVDYVEYYLGKYYGKGEWGSWFIVRDVEHNFAIEYLAEDEVNCIARVHFHPKGGKTEVVELRRFLDLEMGKILTDLEAKVAEQKEAFDRVAKK